MTMTILCMGAGMVIVQDIKKLPIFAFLKPTSKTTFILL